jgi:hypothetical protein
MLDSTRRRLEVAVALVTEAPWIDHGTRRMIPHMIGREPRCNRRIPRTPTPTVCPYFPQGPGPFPPCRLGDAISIHGKGHASVIVSRQIPPVQRPMMLANIPIQGRCRAACHALRKTPMPSSGSFAAMPKPSRPSSTADPLGASLTQRSMGGARLVTRARPSDGLEAPLLCRPALGRGSHSLPP